MEIRRLGPDDAAAYRELRLRALREHPEAFTSSYEEDANLPEDSTRQRLASAQKTFWGAFDAQHGLCGIIGLERKSRAKERHKATVVGMYVTPEVTGRGVGSALIDAVIDEARREGLGLLVLTVTESNSAATKLYELAGFRSFGMEPGAIRVQGRPHSKNHMYLVLDRQ